MDGGRWAVGWTSVDFYELGIGDRGGIYGRMSGDRGAMDGFLYDGRCNIRSVMGVGEHGRVSSSS